MLDFTSVWPCSTGRIETFPGLAWLACCQRLLDSPKFCSVETETSMNTNWICNLEMNRLQRHMNQGHCTCLHTNKGTIDCWRTRAIMGPPKICLYDDRWNPNTTQTSMDLHSPSQALAGASPPPRSFQKRSGARRGGARLNEPRTRCHRVRKVQSHGEVRQRG